MNYHQKHLSACLIALAALFSTVSIQGAWAAVPPLGAESSFSVLGRTAVTCTTSTVVGDVGSGGTFTNTDCTISGAVPSLTAATNAANGTVTTALAALVSDYNMLNSNTTTPCTDTTTLASGTITGPLTLGPGVYCTSAALTGTGVLTLDAGGNANAVWIFKIGAAFTGTNFSVVMINGGQPCNVFWVPNAAVTMTDSALKGNILAGDATGGSITMTAGTNTLAGRALANVAVTMTNASIIGCGALSGSSSCKGEEHKKCNQGVGNGPEGCDPGKSSLNSPFDSNDENGGTPGNPGRRSTKR